MSATTQQPVAAPVGTPANADKPNSLLMLLEVRRWARYSVDDCSAGNDDCLFVYAVQPGDPDISGFAGFENYQYLVRMRLSGPPSSTRSFWWDQC